MKRTSDTPRSRHLESEVAAAAALVREKAERLRDLRLSAEPDQAEESSLLDALYEAHRRGQYAWMALQRDE